MASALVGTLEMPTYLHYSSSCKRGVLNLSGNVRYGSNSKFILSVGLLYLWRQHQLFNAFTLGDVISHYCRKFTDTCLMSDVRILRSTKEIMWYSLKKYATTVVLLPFF